MYVGSREAELCNAVYKGDENRVKELLTEQISPNSKNEEGSYALAIAAEKGHLVIMKLLLDKGANVDQKTGDFFTAVYKATTHNQPECLRELIARGAKCTDRILPFQAAAKGHAECLKILIDAGINCDPAGNFPNTCSPLEMAVRNRHLKCVRLLAPKTPIKASLLDVISNQDDECLKIFIDAGWRNT